MSGRLALLKAAVVDINNTIRDAVKIVLEVGPREVNLYETVETFLTGIQNTEQNYGFYFAQSASARLDRR